MESFGGARRIGHRTAVRSTGSGRDPRARAGYRRGRGAAGDESARSRYRALRRPRRTRAAPSQRRFRRCRHRCQRRPHSPSAEAATVSPNSPPRVCSPRVAPAQAGPSGSGAPHLPGGRQVKVNYELGKPAMDRIASAGFLWHSRETPRIGTTPVVAHLLAPNRRPVQVTSDLAGFWERLYPQVRRELSRRYPKTTSGPKIHSRNQSRIYT